MGWAASSEPVGKKSPAKASPAKAAGADRDVKVVLGNKQMMADEGVAISKAVDDYMRDMEVSQPVKATCARCEAALCHVLCTVGCRVLGHFRYSMLLCLLACFTSITS